MKRKEGISIMGSKHLKKSLLIILIISITATSFFPGNCFADTPMRVSAKGNVQISADSKKITPAQADKMALALTNKTWVWEWVAFFVPYMSPKGVKKLLPASKKSEWAGVRDMTTGKKIKFTKKKINAARKMKPSRSLTRKDIDGHALIIMQSTGNWSYISKMLPYMSHKGIRAVVRCYNKKHGGKRKRAEDYF